MLIVAPLLHATERRPLPEFFIQDLNGQFVSSAGFVRPGNWMIVLVRPDCSPCDKLLEAIPLEPESVPSRFVVILTGADTAAAAIFKARFPALAPAQWYVDEFGNSLPLSQLPAAPVMFGLRQHMIEWSLAGIAPDLRTVRGAMLSWLN
jgi:hypothetical protein